MPRKKKSPKDIGLLKDFLSPSPKKKKNIKKKNLLEGFLSPKKKTSRKKVTPKKKNIKKQKLLEWFLSPKKKTSRKKVTSKKKRKKKKKKSSPKMKIPEISKIQLPFLPEEILEGEQKENSEDLTYQQKVASQYDNVAKEEDTFIYNKTKNSRVHLTQFNNWIKAILVETSCEWLSTIKEKPYTIFDLACGKGGDMFKWSKQPIMRYIGCDISSESINRATQRIQKEEKFGHNNLIERFSVFQWNLGNSSLDLQTEIQKRFSIPEVDIISMQFAMHYLFCNEKTARSLFYSISRVLCDDGLLIATIPDECFLKQKILEANDKNLTKFGNRLYSIEFEPSLIERIHRNDPFMLEYTFTLLPTVELLEECIIKQNVLESIAAEYELEPYYSASFHEFYYEHKNIKRYQNLMYQISKRTNAKRYLDFFPSANLTKDSWDLAGLYKVIAFKRKKRIRIPKPITQKLDDELPVPTEQQQSIINEAVDRYALHKYILQPEQNRDNIIHGDDEKCIIVKDNFPSSLKHFLVLPKEEKELENLDSSDIPLLEYMKQYATDKGIYKEEDYDLIGFHSIPTQKLLHMHIMSNDLSLVTTNRNKRKNIPPYFLPVDTLIRILRKDNTFVADEELLKKHLEIENSSDINTIKQISFEDKKSFFKKNIIETKTQEGGSLDNVTETPITVVSDIPTEVISDIPTEVISDTPTEEVQTNHETIKDMSL